MEEAIMKRIIIAAAILCSAALNMQASGQPCPSRGKPHQHRIVRNSSHTVVYDKDSPDPAVGWHWENGMRVCHNDCDNDEIPGSGFTCSDVTVMGQAMRQCSRQN
jgi:hypothetical protein